METINAGKSVREQRQEALKDRYVEVKQKGTTKALRATDGIELHHDDGAITRALPGDWVAERADGGMGVIPAADFVEFYEPADDAAEKDYDLTMQAVMVPESVDSGEFIPFAGEPDPREGGIHVGADGLAEHERAAGQDAQAQLLAELERENALMAGAALKAQLVDEKEAQIWKDTGEMPEGLIVTKQDGEYVVERAPGHGGATQTVDTVVDPAAQPDTETQAAGEVSIQDVTPDEADAADDATPPVTRGDQAGPGENPEDATPVNNDPAAA